MQRPDGIANVAGGIGAGERLTIQVVDGLHSELRKYPGPQELEGRNAGSLLQHAAGDDESSITVLPGGSGLKVERLDGPPG